MHYFALVKSTPTAFCAAKGGEPLRNRHRGTRCTGPLERHGQWISRTTMAWSAGRRGIPSALLPTLSDSPSTCRFIPKFPSQPVGCSVDILPRQLKFGLPQHPHHVSRLWMTTQIPQQPIPPSVHTPAQIRTLVTVSHRASECRRRGSRHSSSVPRELSIPKPSPESTRGSVTEIGAA